MNYIDKARRLHLECRRFDRNNWEVASQSGSVPHNVIEDGGRVVGCDCKGAEFRGNCVHQDSVRLKLGPRSPVGRVAFL